MFQSDWCCLTYAIDFFFERPIIRCSMTSRPLFSFLSSSPFLLPHILPHILPRVSNLLLDVVQRGAHLLHKRLFRQAAQTFYERDNLKIRIQHFSLSLSLSLSLSFFLCTTRLLLPGRLDLEEVVERVRHGARDKLGRAQLLERRPQRRRERVLLAGKVEAHGRREEEGGRSREGRGMREEGRRK